MRIFGVFGVCLIFFCIFRVVLVLDGRGVGIGRRVFFLLGGVLYRFGIVFCRSLFDFFLGL